MSNKIKKFLNWYIFCLLIFIFIILTIGLFVGPLLLGLFVDPYMFFLYILTLIVGPIIVIVLFTSTPDLYECIVVNGVLFS